MPVVLDLGCGLRKTPGAIGVDVQDLPGVDVKWDLALRPWPFPDEYADRIEAKHVAEHMADLVAFMEECHRVLKPEGVLSLEVPHGATLRFLGDPTHRTPITLSTFRYFEPGYDYAFYSRARFLVVSIELLLNPTPLAWFWQGLWRRRMWTAERLLVRCGVDFGMRALLRKVPSDAARSS